MDPKEVLCNTASCCNTLGIWQHYSITQTQSLREEWGEITSSTTMTRLPRFLFIAAQLRRTQQKQTSKSDWRTHLPVQHSQQTNSSCNTLCTRNLHRIPTVQRGGYRTLTVLPKRQGQRVPSMRIY